MRRKIRKEAYQSLLFTQAKNFLASYSTPIKKQVIPKIACHIIIAITNHRLIFSPNNYFSSFSFVSTGYSFLFKLPPAINGHFLSWIPAVFIKQNWHVSFNLYFSSPIVEYSYSCFIYFGLLL